MQKASAARRRRTAALAGSRPVLSCSSRTAASRAADKRASSEGERRDAVPTAVLTSAARAGQGLGSDMASAWREEAEAGAGWCSGCSARWAVRDSSLSRDTWSSTAANRPGAGASLRCSSRRSVATRSGAASASSCCVLRRWALPGRPCCSRSASCCSTLRRCCCCCMFRLCGGCRSTARHSAGGGKGGGAVHVGVAGVAGVWRGWRLRRDGDGVGCGEGLGPLGPFLGERERERSPGRSRRRADDDEPCLAFADFGTLRSCTRRGASSAGGAGGVGGAGGAGCGAASASCPSTPAATGGVSRRLLLMVLEFCCALSSVHTVQQACSD